MKTEQRGNDKATIGKEKVILRKIAKAKEIEGFYDPIVAKVRKYYYKLAIKEPRLLTILSYEKPDLKRSGLQLVKL